MKLHELRLKNFKRFSDLTITQIPENTKLVLLIGANGSGKSSVFDAFDWLSSVHKNSSKIKDSENYYNKNEEDFDFELNIYKKGKVVRNQQYKNIPQSTDFDIQNLKDWFYGRPSLRIVPNLARGRSFSETDFEKDNDRPTSFIALDDRFLQDVQKYTNDINNALREPLFAGIQADIPAIFGQYIEPFNESLANIFGKNEATAIKIIQFQDATATEPPKLIFKKGNARINYDLLSHGEKQVVIILLNFVVRNKYYQDTIYFIDEMDAHLNTSLQYALLKEITENWIPENSQLWTASHSLGFIDYANDADNAVIIDFDSFDFDQPQILRPRPKNNDIFDIALPKQTLKKILGTQKIVLCEGNNEFLYDLADISDYIFSGVLNSDSLFLKTKNDTDFLGLRDRDYLTNEEIIALKKRFPNYRILGYYTFENYLYHPENIAELHLAEFDKASYTNEIIKQKNEQLDKIIPKIEYARSRYEEFKTNKDIKSKDLSPISSSLRSNDLEIFYPYFNIKDYFKRDYLAKFQLKEQNLVQTNWFRTHIQAILEQ